MQAGEVVAADAALEGVEAAAGGTVEAAALEDAEELTGPSPLLSDSQPRRGWVVA